MEDFFFFYETHTRKTPKRYRKLPEQLPESLRFAHLNPKVAAYLASKERSSHKQDGDDPFGDGMGKKSLLPDINQAFTAVRNQFDSALSNDEDSQRFLYEEAKLSAPKILRELASIIYFYDGMKDTVPKSLEYQLNSDYDDFAADVSVAPREWQTMEMKEQYASQQQEDSDSDSFEDVQMSRSKSRLGTEKSSSEMGSRLNLKKTRPKLGSVVEPSEDGEHSNMKSESRTGRRNESRLSASQMRMLDSSRVGSRRKGSSLMSPRRKDEFSQIAETPTELSKSTALANPAASYMQTINFQLSNKSFEDKGWIKMKLPQEDMPSSKVLQLCVQQLQQTMKQMASEKKRELELGYTKSCVIRYYGEAKKEILLKYRKTSEKPHTLVVFGGKPTIPTLNEERNEGKSLMQASHLDGSTTVYYPSGKLAVIQSASGFGRPGYYTLVYEDEPDNQMLACFTPCGRGVCYHSNGNVRFLATDLGGHIADINGTLERKWKWPQAHVKILEPVVFHLGGCLLFRCVGRHQMYISFNCQKETTRFNVGPAPDAEDFKPDENEQLVTAYAFTSKAAKDMMRIFAPKVKLRKGKAKKHVVKPHITEMQKLAQEMPDYQIFDNETDRELSKLQRRARCLVDNWMQHYRVTIGFASHDVEGMSETPNYSVHTRNIKSAKISDQALNIRKAVLGVDEEKKKARIPSAPLLSGEGGNDEESKDVEQEDGGEKQREGNTVKFEDNKMMEVDRSVSPTALALIDRLTESASRKSARSKASSARSLTPTRQGTMISLASDRTQSAAQAGNVQRSYCPLVIRQQILSYQRIQCRCSRHYVPFIMDLELDEFVNNEAPDGQLVIISVVSSLFPGITKSEEMLTDIYQSLNRNRTRPCHQSRGDVYRIFKYDINSAAEMSDHTTPLLLTRHNVVPGMFLMYCNGKLLFCDHIFNGYGNARKDFKKQVMKSRSDAMQGFSLPKDFRFSPGRGRSGMRSAWGGEIGGAGVDKYGSTGTAIDGTLAPIHRPTSSNSSDNSKEIQIDAIKISSRRPFLPLIESSQIGDGSHIHKHESVSHWISSSTPSGLKPPGKFGSTSSLTTTGHSSLSQIY